MPDLVVRKRSLPIGEGGDENPLVPSDVVKLHTRHHELRHDAAEGLVAPKRENVRAVVEPRDAADARIAEDSVRHVVRPRAHPFVFIAVDTLGALADHPAVPRFGPVLEAERETALPLAKRMRAPRVRLRPAA